MGGRGREWDGGGTEDAQEGGLSDSGKGMGDVR